MVTLKKVSKKDAGRDLSSVRQAYIAKRYRLTRFCTFRQFMNGSTIAGLNGSTFLAIAFLPETS